MNGHRISFLRAFTRHFIRIMSGLMYMVGFFVSAITKRKQSVHDLLTKTLVVRRERPLKVSAASSKAKILFISSLNKNSTVLVGFFTSVLALLMLLFLLLAISSFGSAVQSFSTINNSVSTLGPVTSYVEKALFESGHLPNEIPREVTNQLSLSTGANYSYSPDVGISLSFSQVSASEKLAVVLTPKLEATTVTWSCVGSPTVLRLVSKICPSK